MGKYKISDVIDSTELIAVLNTIDLWSEDNCKYVITIDIDAENRAGLVVSTDNTSEIVVRYLDPNGYMFSLGLHGVVVRQLQAIINGSLLCVNQISKYIKLIENLNEYDAIPVEALNSVIQGIAWRGGHNGEKWIDYELNLNDYLNFIGEVY